MALVFVFSIVVSDVVMGLGSRFGCDFGGKRLRLWVVVTVVVVVMAMAMVEWALWLVGYGGWFCFSVVLVVGG